MTHIMTAQRIFAFGALVCAVAIGAAQAPATKSSTTEVLNQAIAAAGGERALAAATVLKWSAKAVVHTPQRQIQLEGRWIVQPPDRAIVATWEVDKGESSTRRLIVDGTEGWMERGGQRMSMPADVLAHEREQFYLYSVIRLLPLRENGVRLSAIPSQTPHPRALLVQRAGRPDVEAFFDDSGRLARLRTRITDPATKRQVLEDVALEGTIEAAGVRWPRTIRITWDGAPFFDLQLFDFALGTDSDLPAARAAWLQGLW